MCCYDNLWDVLLFFFFFNIIFVLKSIIPSLFKCLFLTFLTHSPSVPPDTFSALSFVLCVPLAPVFLFDGSYDRVFGTASFTVVADVL